MLARAGPNTEANEATTLGSNISRALPVLHKCCECDERTFACHFGKGSRGTLLGDITGSPEYTVEDLLIILDYLSTDKVMKRGGDKGTDMKCARNNLASYSGSVNVLQFYCSALYKTQVGRGSNISISHWW